MDSTGAQLEPPPLRFKKRERALGKVQAYKTHALARKRTVAQISGGTWIDSHCE